MAPATPVSQPGEGGVWDFVEAERAEERQGRAERSVSERAGAAVGRIRDRQRVPGDSGSYERVFTECLHAMNVFPSLQFCHRSDLFLPKRVGE